MGKSRCVVPCLVAILLAVLTTVSVHGNPQYMVLISSQIYTDTPQQGCVHLHHLNETVTVRAFLQSNQGNKNLFNDLVVDKDLFHCFSFTLPRSSHSEGDVSLSVHIKGPTHEFRKKNVVQVKNLETIVFVQTDKPIYKPGQSVKFRVVSVDKNLRPVDKLFPLFYIEDPRKNRIMQWQNINTEHGLKQLSFSLSSEPILGSYKIVILKPSGVKTEHSFTVEEFVLPKFEVKVKVPKIITTLEKKINVTVCGVYTYGKPVPGHVNVRICHKYFHHARQFEDGCKESEYQLDNTGCVTQEESIPDFRREEYHYPDRSLHVNAKIIEEGTGVEFTGSGTSEVTRTVTEVVLVKADPYFRQGLPFFMKVRLVNGKRSPIPNEQIFFNIHETKHLSVATTDQHGLAEFSVDTTKIKDSSFFIKVFHKEDDQCFRFHCSTVKNRALFHQVYRVFSFSKSYVYLEPKAGVLACGQTHTIQAHFTLNEMVLGELRKLDFYYAIMSKGTIVQTGNDSFSLEPEQLKGHFDLTIPVDVSMAPAAQMLFYTILPDGEMIADSINLEVEKCLPNKVHLSFSPAQSLPASEARLRVTASPQSLCGLRAVDRSVQLLKPEADLSPSWVYNLPEMKYSKFTPNLNQLPDDGENCMKNSDASHRKFTYSTLHRDEKDPYRFMEDMGLIAFTNLRIKHPDLCLDYAFFPIAVAFMESDDNYELEMEPLSLLRTGKYTDQPTETVRKYFPETWIWDLIVVNSSGVAEVGVTVPDTITEWKAGALCLSSDTGLGLSPVASLRAFQPFFVELAMPYSVIRGEVFTLKATVMSYLPTCIRVSVHLEVSPDFLAVPVEEDQDSYCICANGRHTASWSVTPVALGNVNFSVTAETRESPELCGSEVAIVPEAGKKDTVIKALIVEPEGIKKEHTFNFLLCASDAKLFEKLTLTLPPKVVNDSARAYFSVLGDILSSAIENTQNLLHMPYGCGEQNMVLFAPNIYVLKYLSETQQLTQKIKSKAIGFLNAGYQRELNYKHRDGSYSAFGDYDGRKPGNTWLTAFVLKSFAQARAFIFIDEMHISQALSWLSQQQKDSGCFRSSGSLFNNAMKGGVDDEVTLSAYITISLLEIPLATTNPVVRKALTCLESAWEATQQKARGSHVYAKALLAYAFALAGNQDKRKEILKSLDEEAVNDGNSIHWERPQTRSVPKEQYQLQAPSAEVEMAAYVLLARLTAQPAPSHEDLISALLIVKWIIKQQNSHGGFSSTQDTVVALHALSRYGAATFAGTEGLSLVTIQSSGTFSRNFQVDNSNHLLLQQVPLPDIPGEYDINVSGNGCVYTQATLKYNMYLEKQESAFALRVQTVPQTCDDPKAHTSFQISLEVSYTGSRPVSNMAIVDVKMISGFIPLKPTVKMLQSLNHVSRTEVSNNNVLIYVDQFTNQTLNFSFTVQQDIPVRNLQPALVKVYDYYEKDEAAFAEYSAPCSTDAKQNF